MYGACAMPTCTNNKLHCHVGLNQLAKSNHISKKTMDHEEEPNQSINKFGIYRFLHILSIIYYLFYFSIMYYTL